MTRSSYSSSCTELTKIGTLPVTEPPFYLEPAFVLRVRHAA